VVDTLPCVDLSTIYRTLQFLKQRGFIGELRLEGQAARYEAVRSGQEHHHALCTVCGAMIEIAPEDLEAVSRTLLQKYGFQVNPVHMTIHGQCARCAAAD
jgi:Fur family ferric uptake transcriptional regulator